VADHFIDTFKSDHKKYEEYWEDIQPFVKYGLLKEPDFFEALKDIIIFKTASGDYVTVEEYKTRNQVSEGKTRIWYAASEDTQVSYLNLMKEQGLEVIFQSSPLDTHLYQMLESKLENVEFMRVDSEINELVEDKTEAGDVEDSQRLVEIFYRALDQKIEASFSEESLKEYFKKYPKASLLLTPHIIQEGKQSKILPYELSKETREELGEEAFNELMNHVYKELTVEVKSLKSPDIPSMIVFSEYMRRWHDMDAITRQSAGNMLKFHTLVINRNNPVIKRILELDSQGKHEEVDNLCAYIHSLSLLEQKPFTGEELKDFIARANSVLNLI
jgi:molecular chaperone HtpG